MNSSYTPFFIMVNNTEHCMESSYRRGLWSGQNRRSFRLVQIPVLLQSGRTYLDLTRDRRCTIIGLRGSRRGVSFERLCMQPFRFYELFRTHDAAISWPTKLQFLSLICSLVATHSRRGEQLSDSSYLYIHISLRELYSRGIRYFHSNAPQVVTLVYVTG